MCGVTGIFCYAGDSARSDGTLARMSDAMRSRGPDDAGQWSSADGRVSLSHRRLSILDLSERGRQPMASSDGLAVVSFNGEIYNYKALRAELEKKGVRFKTGTDTEVLLELYRLEGERLFERLRGMFAFALWDAEKGRLLLARDPYGVKPLYYADDGRVLHFASQVKAILAGGAVSREVDAAGAAGFFLTGSVPEPFTLYQAVRAVPAGSWLSIGETGQPEVHRYFSQPSFSDARLDAPRFHQSFSSALRDTVRCHFVSDVPATVFLSSGVDSAALTGLARDAGIEDLRTLTLGFEEFRGRREDERVLARSVADHYGSRHEECGFTSAEIRNEWPALMAAMDQPTIDGVNTYFVAKAARAKGFKVALSGLGADELFRGYPSFRDVPRWSAFFGCLPLPRFVARGWRRAMLPFLKGGSPKAAGLLEYGGTLEGAYLLKRGLFMPWELEAVLGRDRAREGWLRLGLLSRFHDAAQGVPAVEGVARLETAFYMRNQLLRDADWAGMAHSLEIRVPFVDAFLTREIAPLLAARRDWKKDLAEAPSKPVPAEILRRKKTGFTVPASVYLEQADEWKRVPLLKRDSHWARRWAYAVYCRQTGLK